MLKESHTQNITIVHHRLLISTNKALTKISRLLISLDCSTRKVRKNTIQIAFFYFITIDTYRYFQRCKLLLEYSKLF